MSNKIEILAEYLKVELGDISDVSAKNDSTWFTVKGYGDFRVLNNEEKEIHAKEEIKECWYDWRYSLDELIEMTGLSKDSFEKFTVENGYIYGDSNPQLAELIEKSCGEKRIVEYLLKKYLENNIVGELLDKTSGNEMKINEYFIYQWA